MVNALGGGHARHLAVRYLTQDHSNQRAGPVDQHLNPAELPPSLRVKAVLTRLGPTADVPSRLLLMTTSPDHVGSRESLVAFVRALHRSHAEEGHSWENADLASFLEALAAWIDDADGWYSNAGRNLPADGDWSFFARALRAATTYEWAMAHGRRTDRTTAPVPDACRLVRGTTGNGGGQAAGLSGHLPAPPQFSQADPATENPSFPS
ncbi:DUF7660 family protein [Streptomyces sp. SAI-229]|uniref:DUF7660 family protein n=1 Tax=Streptomyces sp. SAI-229 TaxID=3377731 RepID=UPI003C7DE31B